MLWREKCQTTIMLLGISALLGFISVIGYQTIEKGIGHLNQVQTSYANGQFDSALPDVSNKSNNQQPAVISTMAPVHAQDIVKGKTNVDHADHVPAKKHSQIPNTDPQEQNKKSINMTNGLFVERAGVGMGIILKKGARDTFDYLLHIVEGTK